MTLFALFCLCTTGGNDLTGTSEQGNARISATLYTSDGDPAAGSIVRLRRADYVKTPDLSKRVSKTAADSYTGPDGSFTFDSMDTGTYMIEVTDTTREAALLHCHVDTIKTVVLPDDTLHPFSTVKGRIRPDSTGGRRFIQVEGLERLAEIAPDGSYSLSDLPSGVLTLRTVCPDSANDSAVISEVVTRPAQTTLVPYDGWLFSRPIYLNTTTSGAGVQGNVFKFPVLVRLDAGNFDFNEAKPEGDDIRFRHAGPDSTPLSFEIERWDQVDKRAEIWITVDTVYGDSLAMSFIMQWGNPAAGPITPDRPVFDPAEGFGGVWHLSEEAASLVKDATPNEYSGISSNVTVAEGIIGKAGLFNSDNKSHIIVDNTSTGSLNFQADGHYSVSTWVNSDSIAYNRVIIGKGDVQYYLRIHNFNWRFSEYHDTPAQGWQYTESPYSYGRWVHLYAVRNDTSQYLYVDGVCVDSSKIFDGGEEPRDETFNVEIGRRLLPDGSGGLYFSGTLDEVRICTVARSSDWVKLSYMNQRSDDMLVVFGN